ncbi:hypothetical protein EHS25_009132 [Saitozyma podzolica]|uniref:Uncharacterized protein n=1 Tax=Saitozyma podzolica TaxID=1890683 RepID=A0A427YKY8_9TREE|nr:hypothetical protein EHS25_009132 [Saitozyma podzolica]
MSDNREEAQQELVDAGIEDALGSSLSGSFSPSPPPPKPAVEPTIAPSESAAAAEDTPEQAPIPGMAEWKDTYEAYVSHWQAESSEARSKSESTRLRIEAERAATAKSDADRVKAEKQVREKEVEEKRKEEKLKRELETSATGEGSRKRVKSESGTGKEERERKVREAWEMVKGSERKESPEEVPVDSRGVMDADIVAGQATLAGQHREEIHHPQQRSRAGILALGVRPHHLVRAHPALDARRFSLADLPHALGVPDSVSSFRDVPSLVRDLRLAIFR